MPTNVGLRKATLLDSFFDGLFVFLCKEDISFIGVRVTVPTCVNVGGLDFEGVSHAVGRTIMTA